MQETDELLLETCLLAGKIMMENGSEVYRVEDTMNRIAANAGEANSISYVTATGIFMGLRSSHYAQVENVHDRVINLEKIVAVNRLSGRSQKNRSHYRSCMHLLKRSIKSHQAFLSGYKY